MAKPMRIHSAPTANKLPRNHANLHMFGNCGNPRNHGITIADGHWYNDTQ